MELLLSHWHCILPAAVIIAAMIFMNKKNDKKNENTEKSENEE